MPPMVEPIKNSGDMMGIKYEWVCGHCQRPLLYHRKDKPQAICSYCTCGVKWK